MVDVGEARVFFKVLLDDFNVNLRLPDKFVRSFIGKEKWAKLNLSSSILGKQWTVEIREDSRGFHLSGNRWRHFVQDHDLRFGYFLVFRYLRDMDFLVEPFDHSCCIKLYPPIQEDNTTMDHHVQHSKFSEGKKNSSQETAKDKLRKKNVEKNLKVQKKPQFKITTQPSYVGKRFMNFPRTFPDENNLSTINEAILPNTNGCWPPVKICHTPQNRQHIKETAMDDDDRKHRVRTDADQLQYSRSSEEKRKERNLGEKFKVKNDRPQFKISMAPSYLGKNGYMHFPSRFCDPNHLSSVNEATLTNIAGRHWLVKIRHTLRKNRRLSSAFSSGWTTFKSENNLKEGDVCNFELSSKEGNRTNFFVIFQRSKHDNSHVSGSNISRKVGNSRGNDPSGSVILTSRPHFEITIKNTHLLSECVGIPLSFEGLRYLYDKSKVSLVNPWNGRSWEVGLLHKRHDQHHIHPKFSQGWIEFCDDNKLEEGDVCSFKLLSKQSAAKLEMIVTFHKKPVIQRSTARNESKIPRALYFVVTLKQYNLQNSRSYLNIPASVKLSGIISGKHKVVLKDAEGRAWIGSIYQNGSIRNQFRVRGGGWLVFARDNSLEVDDVCKFKLIMSKTEDNVLSHK